MGGSKCPFYRHSSLLLPVAVLRGCALQPLRGVVGPLFYVLTDLCDGGRLYLCPVMRKSSPALPAATRQLEPYEPSLAPIYKPYGCT